MKRGTINHPKTWRLSRSLGISRRDTLGLLTLLWDFTGDYAPDGNIGRMTDEDIARACDWEAAQSEKLVAALIESGYVDKIPKKSGRLRIHDWMEHCEQWVRKRLTRRGVTDSETSGERPDDGDPTYSPPVARSPSPSPKPEPVAECPSLSLSPKPEPVARPPAVDPAPAAPPDVPPADPDSGSGSAGVSPDSSGSGSGSALLSRHKARVRYEFALHPLIGREGGRRHPEDSKQHAADMTCMREWWEFDIWPEDAPPEVGAKQLAEFLRLVDQAKARGNSLNKPMAWLTRKLRPKAGATA